MSDRSMIRNGEFIASGQHLVSANGRFFACVDDNGNLHLRLGSTSGFSYWQAAGSQGAGKYAVLLQGDGNICSYAYTPGQPLTGNPVWCTWTQPGTDEYFLILQNDGNLCQYRGTGPTDNRGLAWAAGATFSENGPYRIYSATTFGTSVHTPPFVAASDPQIKTAAQAGAVPIPVLPPDVILAEKGAGEKQLWQKLDWLQHGAIVAFALRNLANGLYLSGKRGYAQDVTFVRTLDGKSFWTPGGPEENVFKYHALRPYSDEKLNLCVSGSDPYRIGAAVNLAHWVPYNVPTNVCWLIEP